VSGDDSGNTSNEIPTQRPSHHPPTGRLPAVFDLAFLTGVEDVTELILVRHGEQDIAGFPNAPVGDAIDPPLSARGNKQAEAVGLRFSTQHIDVVYSSNLERARELGYQIARHHGLEPIVLEDLREVEVFRDIPPDRLAVDFVGRQLLLGIRQRMLNEKSWDVYPYSESSFDFRKRTVNAIEGILDGGHNTLAIGLHILALALGDPKSLKKVKRWPEFKEAWVEHREAVAKLKASAASGDGGPLDFLVPIEVLVPTDPEDDVILDRFTSSLWRSEQPAITMLS
jgi:broad specificity phosphatase PhoE